MIVDQDGPGALSFRTLATALGISVASLQRRCGDIAGLQDLVLDQLATRLPEIPTDTDWATATEQRFRALYDLLASHPGLVALRGNRPWLGHEMLRRLVEPQLAHCIAAGMSPDEAIATYRRLYLFTLGAASNVNHRDPKVPQSTTRQALASLDPAEFPVLTGHLATIIPAVTDKGVYYTGLRQLIDAARPAPRTRCP
ncbi:TetR/AcrR family transcriptional regulator C-terminal domain-containing protein [Kitasatospora sp. NPDC004272]